MTTPIKAAIESIQAYKAENAGLHYELVNRIAELAEATAKAGVMHEALLNISNYPEHDAQRVARTALDSIND